MAKRRRTRKKAAVTVSKPRRRRNPTARALAVRAGGRARSAIGGMQIKQALKNVPLHVIGMLAGGWSAKRGTDDLESSATQTDPESWTGASYLKGAVGSFVAGFIGSMIRPGWGQKILEGGLSLMAYKIAVNELVPKSEWLQRQFGADDEPAAIAYGPDGVPYLLGQGYDMPLDERHRLPEGYEMLGDQLEPPGRLGDQLEPPGRLGDAWENAYFRGEDKAQGDPFARVFHGA